MSVTIEKILLSIVIPVYNVEQFIGECVDSIYLKQNIDIQNVEVICVDDGSTDSSLKILQEKAKIYKNLIVISQENQGVSVARNTGIDKATGKYVWFVDADDYILPNVLKRLLPLLENDYEWISFGYVFNAIPDDLDHEKPFQITVAEDNYPEIAVWRSIVRLDIIKTNNIRYNKLLKYSQDVLFSLTVAARVKEIAKINAPLYFYRNNETSATRKMQGNAAASKKQFDCLTLQNELLAQLLKLKIKNKCVKSKIIATLIGNNNFILNSDNLKYGELAYKKAYPLPFFVRLRYFRRKSKMPKMTLIQIVFFPRFYLRKRIKETQRKANGKI